MNRDIIITHKNSYYFVHFSNGELLGAFPFEWDAIERAEAYKRNSRFDVSITVDLTWRP